MKVFGDHNGIFAELMLEFGKTGRFNYRHAPGIVITAFVSLIAGGSLGPEAPLADACGGIGTLMADKLKLDEQETRTWAFPASAACSPSFITSPFGGPLLGLESARGGAGGMSTYFWTLFPSLLASSVATVVFVLLSGTFFETLYKFPAYSPRLVDLAYAVPLGLIGGLVGALFMLALKRLQGLLRPMKQHLVLRGLLGGLVMGTHRRAAAADAVLGRGADDGPDYACGGDRRGDADRVGAGQAVRYHHAARHGLERRLHLPDHVRGHRAGPGNEPLCSPASRVAVAVAATMAGALVAALKAPLFAALFTMVLVQMETSAVVAVAVVAGALLTAVLAALAARRAASRTPPLPEPA